MVKAITFKFDPDTIIKRLASELDNAAQRAKESLESTTVNFQRVSPTFLIEKEKDSENEIRLVAPKDDQFGRIWMFLDGGTSVRYAILSPDWRSKTTPGTLSTGLGAGRVLYIDINDPQPGIEARLWSELVASEQQDLLVKNVDGILEQTKVFSAD